MENKVVFDLISLQESPDSKFHGGGEYAKNIFFSLIENRRNFLCIYSNKLHLDDIYINACERNNIELIGIDSKYDIYQIMCRDDISAFYSAIPYDYYDVNFNGKKVIITIHGLRDIECPSDSFEYIYREGALSKLKLLIKKLIYSDKKLINNSKKKFEKIFDISNLKVLTVSEHSKYSILSCFPRLNSDSIKVVPAPHKYMELKKEIEKEKRFLLISGNRWIKNNYRAIKALDSLMDDRRIANYKVTVVGWNNKKVHNKLNNKDNFSFIDYVNENRLNELFISSEYFIYPTLNEGYGYPPLKAFESDTVVISSCHTSIIEVCKDAALYFNPYSIIEMKNRILNLVYDEKLKKKLILNGRNIIKNLPNSSQLTMDIINEIFEEKI